jgi:hypothetical protein
VGEDQGLVGPLGGQVWVNEMSAEQRVWATSRAAAPPHDRIGGYASAGSLSGLTKGDGQGAHWRSAASEKTRVERSRVGVNRIQTCSLETYGLRL